MSIDSSKKHAFLLLKENRCLNCGGSDRVGVRLIVPESMGGKCDIENFTALCRACEMALEIFQRNPTESHRRAVNFWITKKFHEEIKNSLNDNQGIKSIGSLIRYLMKKYVDQPERFDDLEQHQIKGTEIKINIWADRDIYEDFKTITDKNGSTVTDAIKALLFIYINEVDQLLQPK